MKAKISRNMRMPMLCGFLLSAIVGCGVGMFGLMEHTPLSPLSLAILFTVYTLWIVVQPLRRAAWVYSNMHRFHTAEYFYGIGNGMPVAKAMKPFEKRAMKTVTVWIRRNLQKQLLVFSALAVVANGSWLGVAYAIAFIIFSILMVEIAVWTFILVGRKMCYDKYGNIKK